MALNPVHWLASWPKSGSTWIRMMLTGYHYGTVNINIPTEITSLDIQRYAHNVVSPVPLNQLQPKEIVFLRYAALLHLSVRHPVKPILLKTHNANVKIEGVDLAPSAMTAGAIYIVRDPRDVVISYAEHMGSNIDASANAMACPLASIDDQANGLRHFMTTWNNHVNSWLDADFPVLLVRYEDLKTDSTYWLREIVRFLGMEPNEEKVERGVQLAEFTNLQKQEEQEGFVEASPNAERFFKLVTSGHWREVLTKGQQCRVEEVCAEGMDRLGYEREYL